MIAALLKLVDLRVEIDPLTGELDPASSRTLGASPADLTALETALRLAAPSKEVVAVSAAPATLAAATEAMLRDALAAGAQRAVRVQLTAGASSAQVATALAPVVSDARYVVCGDASLDRGSGSVPAFVAARLGAAQALGLTSVSVQESDELSAERRLDVGRRERLLVPAPAVLSVEAGARLRRAPLSAVLATRTAPIDVIEGVKGPGVPPPPERYRSYRAPARLVPTPSAADPRTRVLALTGMLNPPRARRVVQADAATCADELLSYLAEHGCR